MDTSNGYEKIAKGFIEVRGQKIDGTGTSMVRNWAKSLSANSKVLDLGCGTGIPITNVLIDEGLIAYGVDASPTLIKAFRENFPDVHVVCEPAENSLFFNRKFDAIIAWGLIFLLSTDAQAKVIHQTAEALQAGGKFLFTAPYQKTEWKDVMTKQTSVSLGSEKYRELLSEAGLTLMEEFNDEGENH